MHWGNLTNSPQEVILELRCPSQTGCHLLTKGQKKQLRLEKGKYLTPQAQPRLNGLQ